MRGADGSGHKQSLRGTLKRDREERTEGID
jgi:hypothetical protein